MLKKELKKLNISKSIKYEKVESFPSCAEKAEHFDILMVSVAESRLKLFDGKILVEIIIIIRRR